MKKYLIVNTGSASKRYAIYFGDELKVSGHLQVIDGRFFASITYDGKTFDCDLRGEIPENTARCFFEKIREKKIIDDKCVIDAIGIRIVAPGDYFTEDRIIDSEYIKKLSDVEESAPLHIKPIIEEINHLKEAFPNSAVVGISDSKFHKSMQESFRVYSIFRRDTENMGIYRFGYHGISAKSVLDELKNIISPLPEKTIICHLGSGASVTAVKDGKSFNTSMGFTPLEGLTMRTRVGNIDPGALIYLAKKKKFSLEDMENYLNTKCGLFGLSGVEDTRKIIKFSEEGDENAQSALDIFVNDVKEYIGAYSALMNGVDLIVFSGAIGEGADVVRAKICDKMDYLGLDLDENKNKQTIGINGVISSGESKVKLLVVKTNEMEEIFKSAKEIWKKGS